MRLTNEALAGAFWVNTLLAGLPPFIQLEKLPERFRLENMEKHFVKAKKILDDIGV